MIPYTQLPRYGIESLQWGQGKQTADSKMIYYFCIKMFNGTIVEDENVGYEINTIQDVDVFYFKRTGKHLPNISPADIIREGGVLTNSQLPIQSE